jgi:hypothetical protein
MFDKERASPTAGKTKRSRVYIEHENLKATEVQMSSLWWAKIPVISFKTPL